VIILVVLALYCLWPDRPEPVRAVHILPPRPEPRKPLTPVFSDASIAHYKADTGRVCPLIAAFPGSDLAVAPFVECSPEVQAEACAYLAAEWGDVLTHDYIVKEFGHSDVMYVMSERGRFVAAAAVDRKNFYPFISHVFVRPDMRGRGHARAMLDVGHEYAGRMKFSVVKLWCFESLVPFYERMGYEREGAEKDDKGRDVVVMTKQLAA